jgi:hypothetical protein
VGPTNCNAQPDSRSNLESSLQSRQLQPHAAGPINHVVKLSPQPQLPLELGFLKTNSDLLTITSHV